MGKDETPQWYRDLEKAIVKFGSQQAVADQIGVSRACVNWWYNRRRWPNASSQLKLKALMRGLK